MRVIKGCNPIHRNAPITQKFALIINWYYNFRLLTNKNYNFDTISIKVMVLIFLFKNLDFKFFMFLQVGQVSVSKLLAFFY